MVYEFVPQSTALHVHRDLSVLHLDRVPETRVVALSQRAERLPFSIRSSLQVLPQNSPFRITL